MRSHQQTLACVMRRSVYTQRHVEQYHVSKPEELGYTKTGAENDVCAR